MLSTPHLNMWIQDGILFCVYADETTLDLKLAKHVVELRLQCCEGLSYPIVVDVRGIKSIDQAARQFLAGEGLIGVTAGAMIVGSPLTRFLGNIFMLINKPTVPTQLFGNEREACEWLKSLNIQKINYVDTREGQTA